MDREREREASIVSVDVNTGYTNQIGCVIMIELEWMFLTSMCQSLPDFLPCCIEVDEILAISESSCLHLPNGPRSKGNGQLSMHRTFLLTRRGRICNFLRLFPLSGIAVFIGGGVFGRDRFCRELVE